MAQYLAGKTVEVACTCTCARVWVCVYASCSSLIYMKADHASRIHERCHSSIGLTPFGRKHTSAGNIAYRVWLRLPDVLHEVIVSRCDGLFRKKRASSASDALRVFGVPGMNPRRSGCLSARAGSTIARKPNARKWLA